MTDDSTKTVIGMEQELLDLLGPAYAKNFNFWKAIVYSSILQGGLMALVALAFVNAYVYASEQTWKTTAYTQAIQTPFDILTSVNITDTHSITAFPTQGTVSLDPLRLGNGQWWYIVLLLSTGFVVGLIKVLWSTMVPAALNALLRPWRERNDKVPIITTTFPDRIPGFLQDLVDLKAHDLLLPIAIMITSALSIGCGASVGPEAALGAAGTAMGTLLGKLFRRNNQQTKSNCKEDVMERALKGDNQLDDSKANLSSGQKFVSFILPDFSGPGEQEKCALDGMAASFGAIFPSQFMAPLMIFELASHHWFGAGPDRKFPSYVETIARSGIASTVSYAIFVAIKDQTLLSSYRFPVAMYDLLHFELIYLVYGLFLGIVSGLIGFVGFLCLAVFNLVGSQLNQRLNNWGGGFGKISTPCIGGALVGALCVACPLCLGDGSDQIFVILTMGRQLGLATLIISGFVKLVCVGISLGFGFVGGPFFPLVLVGVITGSVTSILLPQIPVILSFACCIVAVPAAIMPGMFTLTVFSGVTFALGGAATSTVFVACIASYTTVCGMGLIQSILLRGIRLKREKAAALLAKEMENDAVNGESYDSESIGLP